MNNTCSSATNNDTSQMLRCSAYVNNQQSKDWTNNKSEKDVKRHEPPIAHIWRLSASKYSIILENMLENDDNDNKIESLR